MVRDVLKVRCLSTRCRAENSVRCLPSSCSVSRAMITDGLSALHNLHICSVTPNPPASLSATISATSLCLPQGLVIVLVPCADGTVDADLLERLSLQFNLEDQEPPTSSPRCLFAASPSLTSGRESSPSSSGARASMTSQVPLNRADVGARASTLCPCPGAAGPNTSQEEI
jgi:hypothetical protein